MTPSTLDTLGTWTAGLTFDAIPPAAIHAAKRCILDWTGCAWAGGRHPTHGPVLALARDWFKAGPCWAVGAAAGLNAPGAAFVNGATGHAWDYDDTSYAGILHATTVVYPAVLALAQERNASGRDLLTAFVAGVEVVYALGVAATDNLYLKGVFNTAQLGVMGAAAGCARLLGLDGPGCAAAMAHGASQAAGLRAAFGTSAKPILAGRASETGVRAAALAEAGLDAPRSYLEAPGGFLSVMNDGRGGPVEIGETWRLLDPGVMFKLFPVCSAAQAATEAARMLAREMEVAAPDIAAVTGEVTPLVMACLTHRRPTTPEAAQFSLDFPVAAVLLWGDVTLAHLNAATLADPALRALMVRVTMRLAPELDRSPDYLAGMEEGAYVTLTTRDGRTSERLFRPAATGTPAVPMTDGAVEEKARGCLGFGGVADGEGLIASVWELGSSEVPKSRAVPGNIGEGTFVYVKGRPATFATSGELPWKRTLAESLGNVMLEGTGLVLRFTRQTTSKPQFRGDIDNLCEPVFSVVINKLGWLGGRRPNMRFWIASVKSGSQEGVELAAFKEVPEQEWCNSESLVFEGEYFGEIPKDGRNEEFPGWIREKWNNQPLREGESLGVHLQFNSNDINIGGVSTGCVKSILDCTYPIIGGYAGAPDDWKIRKIIVEKDTPMNGVVKIYIYNIGLEEIFFGGSVLRPYSNLRCP